MHINAIAIDAAFANMGLARVRLEQTPKGWTVACLDLQLVKTESHDRKVVRKSSDDLRRAQELTFALRTFAAGSTIAFAEVPSGSQSAAAARALGIAVGVLGSCPLPIIEVSPMEVKRLFGANRKVTKDEIIDWAVKEWPKAPWLRAHNKATGSIVKANEHLADAMAVVKAGILTPEFQRMMTLYATSSPNMQRLAPSGKPRVRLQV